LLLLSASPVHFIYFTAIYYKTRVCLGANTFAIDLSLYVMDHQTQLIKAGTLAQSLHFEFAFGTDG